MDVYNNVIDQAGSGFVISDNSDSGTHDNNVHNNVIANSTGMTSSSGFIFSGKAIDGYGPSGSNNRFDNNISYSNPGGIGSENNVSMTGNTTADPQFADANYKTTHNYQVKTTSPAASWGLWNGDLSNSSNTPPPSDTTSPTVSITSPVNNSYVSGQVQVTAIASDNVGVTKVELYVDGALNSTINGAGPYNFTVDSTGAAEGSSHSLQAKAYDSAGNTPGVSAVVNVTVRSTAADTTPPALTWSVPAAGATVSGQLNETAGNCQASATDPSGVAKVEFFLDGNLNNTELSAPYSCVIDTTRYANGSHTLGAKAYDTLNNATSIINRSVTFNNTDTTKPSAPGTPVANAVSANQIDLSWTAATDASGIKSYNILRKLSSQARSPALATPA